jgi:hypothetical protein
MSDFDPPHLIYARGAENIVIEGSGSINGNGDATYPDHQPHERRPSLLIELVECKNVRIRDPHSQHRDGPSSRSIAMAFGSAAFPS